MRWYKIANADCLVALKRLSDASVDLLCVDPPYGILFMGRDWDKAVPSVEVWKECLRVMKPGAFGFIFCTPRQDCLAQMIVRLGQAGFETGFTSIYWVYSSGFPKAQNLSKAADKRAGAEREVVGTKIGKGGENLNRLARPNKGDSADAKGVGAYGVGAKQVNVEIPITIPYTNEAKRLDGAYAGFQPKPAVEPILVVMKPLAHKTYLDQALDNGKGCMWLNDGRIPTEDNLDGGAYAENPTKREDNWSQLRTGDENVFRRGGAGEYKQPLGRFPANVLVQDDALRGAGQTKSVKSTREHDAYEGVSNTKMLRGVSTPENQYDDAGSVSRYFDLDAWWQRRMQDLPASVQETLPCMYSAKASKKEKNIGLSAERVNDHPTVKPIKLISYLITIGSRPNDVVLDPFMGSGTTGVAALQLRRRFLGVELEQHYYETAEQRLKYMEEQLEKK